MDHRPLGRLLSRREAMRWLGGGAAWLITGTMLARGSAASGESPVCLFRPEQTEGPSFVAEDLRRSVIRPGPTTCELKPRLPLALTVALSRADHGRCQPLPGAQVDIWHCDALGIYSDVKDPQFDTTGRKCLRGHQLTDAQGEAKFLTIYPGWYYGRTVHIHIKVRVVAGAKRTFEFTSQMYFEDNLSDRIHAATPYARKGKRTARNQDDRIFRRGGEHLVLAPTQTDDGYAATFAASLQFPPG